MHTVCFTDFQQQILCAFQQPVCIVFNQFKNFFENAQGCTDLSRLCNEYSSNTEELLIIIKSIHYVVPDKSIKNRLTRLVIKLKKIQDVNCSQNLIIDGNDNETFYSSS